MKSLEIVSGRDSRKGRAFEEVFGKADNIKKEHLEIKKKERFLPNSASIAPPLTPPYHIYT